MNEYCEILSSDVPEFSTGYSRYACMPLPSSCDISTGDPCACLEATARCDYFGTAVGGHCTVSDEGDVALHCGIGG